jgi:hypothetical protein
MRFPAWGSSKCGSIGELGFQELKCRGNAHDRQDASRTGKAEPLRQLQSCLSGVVNCCACTNPWIDPVFLTWTPMWSEEHMCCQGKDVIYSSTINCGIVTRSADPEPRRSQCIHTVRLQPRVACSKSRTQRQAKLVLTAVNATAHVGKLGAYGQCGYICEAITLNASNSNSCESLLCYLQCWSISNRIEFQSRKPDNSCRCIAII